MEKISTAEKLALVEAIRKEQNINEGKMRTRTNILYGDSYKYGDRRQEPFVSNPISTEEGALAEFNKQYPSTFGIRMIIAIVLFIGFFIMDLQNLSFGSINSNMIFQEITKEFSISLPENILDFM